MWLTDVHGRRRLNGAVLQGVVEAIGQKNLQALIQILEAEHEVSGNTTLSLTCRPSLFFYAVKSRALSIVRHLLKDPHLSISPDHPGPAPNCGSLLFHQWARTHYRILRLLLADPRLDLDSRDTSQHTILMRAARPCGKRAIRDLRFVRELAASGRIFDFEARGRVRLNLAPWAPGEEVPTFTVLEMLVLDNRDDEVAHLIRLMASDPQEATRRARLSLGMTMITAAKTYALVVLLCDDFLVLRDNGRRDDELQDPRKRFLLIAARLPADLQQVLCLRAAGCRKTFIPSHDSEGAFRSLRLPALRHNDSFDIRD